MYVKTKQWADGSSATIQYDGQGDGQIIITSDPNDHYEARSMQITVETTDGSGIQRTVTIQQAAKQRIDLSAAVVTAANQTYSGSAKTPTPTITLNGSTVPSSGYDVTYSNNTNAGTATITVTGKGDYTGTAYGTFTINKATPSYIEPSTRSLTYNGRSQYLTTSGSTSHGIIYYSTDGSNWYTSRRTATTAGSYSCYWKLVGDSNHTDISSTYIGTTSIAKASRTLSFADSYMVLNTSSTGTKTATPSAGSDDGAITYSIANTTYATINSSTGAVTSKTSDGSVIVTATIAEGQNYLGATATYTLYVFATTHNYSYSGSANNVTLPPGTYKLECWGAQGGANKAESWYSISAIAGGKGGYSVGQLTVAQALAIQVVVGGQGGSSSGGYNGGGSSAGTSSYESGGVMGVTYMGAGGGATDIRLSSGSLYSRMIVAGGGSGGAMCYRKEIVSEEIASYGTSDFINSGLAEDNGKWINYPSWGCSIIELPSGSAGKTLIYSSSNSDTYVRSCPDRPVAGATVNYTSLCSGSGTKTATIPSNANYLIVSCLKSNVDRRPDSLVIQNNYTNEDWQQQQGYVGGGTNGGGYYPGRQTGDSWRFGKGSDAPTRDKRYAGAGGGSGWYGGGTGSSNSSMNGVSMSGGGSGFVNTAASAGNRPSGYTGLQLDSGTTYAGNTSFPSTGGGTETGHSGNGYARITRL